MLRDLLHRLECMASREVGFATFKLASGHQEMSHVKETGPHMLQTTTIGPSQRRENFLNCFPTEGIAQLVLLQELAKCPEP